MKRCSKCKKWKDESEFYKDRSKKDGLDCWCKKCECVAAHEYYRRKTKRAGKYTLYEQRHRVIDGAKQKRCSRCNKWKDESYFYKNLSSKDGLNHSCAKCLRERTRKSHYKKVSGPVKRYYTYEQYHRVVHGVEKKRCRLCKKWKAESEFYRNRTHKDGLAYRCKECANKATNEARRRRVAVRN